MMNASGAIMNASDEMMIESYEMSIVLDVSMAGCLIKFYKDGKQN